MDISTLINELRATMRDHGYSKVCIKWTLGGDGNITAFKIEITGRCD